MAGDGSGLLEVAQQRMHRTFRDRLGPAGGRLVIALLPETSWNGFRLDMPGLYQPVQPRQTTIIRARLWLPGVSWPRNGAQPSSPGEACGAR